MDGMGVNAELRKAITGDGRSLNQLARDAGCDVAAISRFVRGQRGLLTDSVEKLCDALKLELRPKRTRK